MNQSKKYKKVRVNPARKSNYEKYGFRFLKAFVNHLDEKNWFDSTYISDLMNAAIWKQLLI